MTTSAKKIRIILVDDHPVVREGLRRILGSFGQIEILGEASNGSEAVILAQQLRPDVVVMDITMPEMGGIEATATLTRELPGSKVLALSMHENRNYITQALRAGARGYLLKDSSPEELVRAINEVFEGASAVSPQAANALIATRFPALNQPGLSPRETEVLRFIARGFTNKEIGLQLGLSVRTIESHRENLIRKTGISSVAELTRYAVNHGIIETQTSL